MPPVSAKTLLRIMETMWKCNQLDLIARMRRSKQVNKTLPTLERLERISDWDLTMLLRLIETLTRYGCEPDMMAASRISEAILSQKRLHALDRLINKIPDMKVNMSAAGNRDVIDVQPINST